VFGAVKEPSLCGSCSLRQCIISEIPVAYLTVNLHQHPEKLSLEVLTVVLVHIAVFWVVMTPCGLVDGELPFGRIYCLHHSVNPITVCSVLTARSALLLSGVLVGDSVASFCELGELSYSIQGGHFFF